MLCVHQHDMGYDVNVPYGVRLAHKLFACMRASVFYGQYATRALWAVIYGVH